VSTNSKACPTRIGTAAANAALDIAPPAKVKLNHQYRMACEINQRTGLLLLAEYSSGKVNSAEIKFDVMEIGNLNPVCSQARNKGNYIKWVTHPLRRQRWIGYHKNN
jgi:hypothetical protein